MASLSVRGLRRRFTDEAVALQDVSFHIEDGRIAAVVGPSGCGKTTLLRLIAGLDSPEAGDVLVDGVSVMARAPHLRGIGLMFQELALFPHLSVAENIEFGLRRQKWQRTERELRIAELLRLVGLVQLGRRRMHELSGGERQRVALARTLAPQPGVLLLDEPLGALDEQRKAELRVQLRELLRRLGVTAVVVSHDLRDAVAIADDLIVMERGRVLQSGPLPDVLARPDSVAVAHMVGYLTLLEGRVEQERVHELGVGSIAIPEDGQLTGRVEIVGHPSSLLAIPPGRGLGLGVAGVVAATRPDGPTAQLEVSLGDRRRVLARWEWDLEPPPPGTRVELAARPESLRFFAHHGGVVPDVESFEAETAPYLPMTEGHAHDWQPASDGDAAALAQGGHTSNELRASSIGEPPPRGLGPHAPSDPPRNVTRPR